MAIVNDRPDIAALSEADGVHVGQEELSVADARRIVGPSALIGVSTHNADQVRQAVLDGAERRLDLLVDDCLILELKACEGVAPVHIAQTLSYLRATGLRLALLINFNVTLLHRGIKRIIAPP